MSVENELIQFANSRGLLLDKISRKIAKYEGLFRKSGATCAAITIPPNESVFWGTDTRGRRGARRIMHVIDGDCRPLIERPGSDRLRLEPYLDPLARKIMARDCE